MPELDIQDDHQAIVVGDFRLAFRWSGDRWAHELEHRGPRDPRHLAWSFEMAPEHDNPSRVVSPTFQQLSFQEDGPWTQALLVGQSGPHHFSAVFEVSEQKPPTPEGRPYPGALRSAYIKVEVADRCRAPVDFLASTYRVAADSGSMADDRVVEKSPGEESRSMAWDLGPHRLEFSARLPANVAFAEDGRRATRVQAVAGGLRGQPTHLWTYCWHWYPDIRR